MHRRDQKTVKYNHALEKKRLQRKCKIRFGHELMKMEKLRI